MAELAYAADLKSAAFGLVGSSPTAPTSSLRIDGLHNRLDLKITELCHANLSMFLFLMESV